MQKHFTLLAICVLTLFAASAQKPKKTALTHYNEGITLMQAGKYNEALPSFKKATELNKKYHEAFTMAGIAYTRIFNENFARITLKEAIRLKPDYGPAYNALGDLFKDIVKKTDSAMLFYKKAIALNFNTKELNYNLAWCYNDRGKYEEALPHLKTSLELDNEYVPAYHEIAFTYRRLKQLEECIEQFKKNIAISKNEIALYYTGLCQMELGKKADALATLDVLKSINSKYAVSLRRHLDKKEKQEAGTPTNK